MIEENFTEGSYYLIICKAGNQAVRVKEKDPTKFEQSRLVGVHPSHEDDGQYFMVEKIKEQHYQFVHCQSGLVFDEESDHIELKKGKQKRDQLFAISLAPSEHYLPYFYIKLKEGGDKALCLQGSLRYGELDPNDQTFYFRFEEKQNATICNSAIIQNNMSGKAIDVPEATFQPGQRLIQWTKNKRWNQRWFFEYRGQNILIKSALNGLVLDIEGESRENGAKVVQWKETGGANQLWRPQKTYNEMYKFQSCHEPSLYLAIRKEKEDDGAQLEVSNQDNPSMFWKLQGTRP